MVTLVQSQGCGSHQYPATTGFCCNVCPAGRYLAKSCLLPGANSFCDECPKGYYTEIENYSEKCHKCTPCESDEVEKTECTPSTNRVCVCKIGFYKPQNSFFCIPQVTPTPTTTPSSRGTGLEASLPYIIVAVIVLLVIVLVVVIYFQCIRKSWRCAKTSSQLSRSQDVPLNDTENLTFATQENTANNWAQEVPLLDSVIITNGVRTQAATATDYTKYNVPISVDDLVEIDTIRRQSPGVKFVTVMRNAGLRENEIAMICQNYRDDVDEQDHQMLYKWLQVKGRNATFAVILKAMDEGNFQKLKEDCEKKFDEIIKATGVQETVCNEDDGLTGVGL